MQRAARPGGAAAEVGEAMDGIKEAEACLGGGSEDERARGCTLPQVCPVSGATVGQWQWPLQVRWPDMGEAVAPDVPGARGGGERDGSDGDDYDDVIARDYRITTTPPPSPRLARPRAAKRRLTAHLTRRLLAAAAAPLEAVAAARLVTAEDEGAADADVLPTPLPTLGTGGTRPGGIRAHATP